MRPAHSSVRYAVALALGALCAEQALAGNFDVTQKFAIPPQKLSSALLAFAGQSSVHVMTASESLANLTSRGVSGERTAREALDLLLQGTGLRAREISTDVVTIERAGEEAAASGAAPVKALHLAVAQQEADAGLPSREELEEVVVKSRIVFTQNDAFGATKMGLAIKDTPQTVMIVTKDLMQVAGLQQIEDTYKLDASAGAPNVPDPATWNYYRGFRVNADSAVRIDGFRVPCCLNLDLALLDRYEILKGAVSSLYGQNQIGGVINAVSKVPQRRFAGELGVEGSQYDEYRVDADFTGPVAGSDAWSYRLIGAYRDAGSFLDFGEHDRRLFSGTLQYQPGDATKLMVRAFFQDETDRFAWAPALQFAGDGAGYDDPIERALGEGLRYVDVPRSRFYGMPWNTVSNETRTVQFQGEHEFANGWTLRAHAQSSRNDQSLYNVAVSGPFEQDGTASSAFAYGGEFDNELYGGEINLFGDVEFWGRDHTLFLGVDYNDTRATGTSVFAGLPGSVFNAYAPDYSSVPSMRHIDDYAYVYQDETDRALFGGTVQLLSHVTDRLSVLASGRYSKDRLHALGGSPLTFEEVSGQGGVTYALNDSLNLYASYGQTFNPQTARVFVTGTPGGRLADPEEGTTLEAGLKGDWGGNLSAALTLFDMEKTNILQRDPLHPDFRLEAGTQSGRGVELSLQGRLLPELSVSTSFAYLDAEFTEGEFEGLQPANAPEFGVSAFGTYEILDGGFKGVGFGLGVVHKRGLSAFDAGWTRDAGEPVVFDFGDFTEVDARVFYRRGKWDWSLNVSNLLDERYYSPTTNLLSQGVNVNPPRTIRARVNLRLD